MGLSMNNEAAENANESKQKVVRDSTFHRSVADKAAAFDLGRDFELSFLQAGPAILQRVVQLDEDGDEESEKLELEPQLTEVSRVRLARPSAFTLAMFIINKMAENDELDLDALIGHFRKVEHNLKADAVKSDE